MSNTNFSNEVEKVLQTIIDKAKADHAANLPPDASSLIKPIIPQEVDQAKIDEVISQLSTLTSTKNGLAKAVTILHLVIKYASKI